ncbi:MAG: hypothetical protein JXM72_09485 [Deltaproteobacteria bacterium]|nr:hypothetical protein [Deltaproteobacteria bacterium]
MKGFFLKQTLSWIIMLILLLVAVPSCSKNSSGDYFLPIFAEEDIEYSGSTEAAALNKDNAQIILEEAFLGGSAGSGIVSPISTVAAGGYYGYSPSPAQYFRKTFDLLVQEITSIDQQDLPAITSEVISQPIDIDGPCGGNCSGNLSIDDETGDVSGKLRYNDYCDMEIISDGRISIQGNINLTSVNLDMVFTNFSVSYEGNSQTMSGTVSMESSTGSSYMTMNVCVRDDSSGRTCWMSDYVMYVIEYDTYDEISVSGRFYDPDYGYATLSTPESFIVYHEENYPSQGILVATGAGGSSARLVVLSVETFRIDVDEDGNGTYEWNSGEQNWED